MTFQIIGDDQPTLDVPPELASLTGLDVVPIVVAGVGVTAGTFAAWLAQDGWSTGEYNNFMLKMNDIFKDWDKLGWGAKGQNGKSCWANNPRRRKAWKALWARFGKHWRQYGQVSYVLTDSVEGPARDLMQELLGWGPFFEKVCGAEIGVAGESLDPGSGVAPAREGGMADMVKYAAWAIGGLVALNVITGLRGAFPRKPPQ